MTVVYRFGRFELQPATRRLLAGGRQATLGARAFDVLQALVERRDRLVTKEELLDLAWHGLVVEEGNLHVQVSFLRKILDDGSIETVAGKGYRFAAQTEVFEQAPAMPATTPNNNLPRPLTQFVGHDADFQEYTSIVENNRLVALTGAGGVGKTRLAVELTWRLLPKFAHGIWFVDLAPLSDAERVPLTVAMALGLRERPGQGLLDTLCEHLVDQQLLLVLDNCEHLIDACTVLIQTLLDRTNRVKILATSREALGVAGEHALTVRSLSCPPSGEANSAANLGNFEAVCLFLDRARLVQPAFTLDATTATDVADICRRLDGIPLAIELAAARMKALSVAELKGKLDDRFRLLVGGPRMALPRQQTLLATIKWSFDLLTEDERQLLYRLSVFDGGWTLQGAAAVGESANDYEVLDVLTRLIDKSLISTNRGLRDDSRYSMLESVRQYCADALTQSGGFAAAARRHLEYFVGLGERSEPELLGSQQTRTLERLAPELENIVQALTRGSEVLDESELALRLAATLSQFWFSMGMLRLGYDLTKRVLSRVASGHATKSRARALLVATRIAVSMGLEEGHAWGLQCLTVAQSADDNHVAAGALAHLAGAAATRKDFALGLDYGEAALHLARAYDDRENVRRALNQIAIAHTKLGNVKAAMGSYQEALELGRVDSDYFVVAILASNLSELCIMIDDFEEARSLLMEALKASSTDKYVMHASLARVSALAAARGEWQFAALLWGAIQNASRTSGFHSFSLDEPYLAPFFAAIADPQAHPELQAPLNAGSLMTLDAAVQEARSWLEQSAPNM